MTQIIEKKLIEEKPVDSNRNDRSKKIAFISDYLKLLK